MNKFKKSIVMYHDNSGQQDIFEVLSKCSPNILKLSNETVFFQSEEQGDFYKKCEELKDFDLVIVVGGDGTINEVVNGLYDYDMNPVIGIIPGGSFNDFSRTVNIGANPEEASENLLDAEVKEYDCILNDDKIALNFWTVGMASENAQKMQDADKSTFGVLTYIPKIFETLTQDNSFDYEMELDGETIKGNAVMVFVANGLYSGGVEVPISDISPSDGVLNVFVVEQSNIGAFKAMFGQSNSFDFNEQNEGVQTFKAKEIKFISPEGLVADTDGELYQKTPSNIKVVEKRFKFLSKPFEQ